MRCRCPRWIAIAVNQQFVPQKATSELIIVHDCLLWAISAAFHYSLTHACVCLSRLGESEMNGKHLNTELTPSNVYELASFERASSLSVECVDCCVVIYLLSLSSGMQCLFLSLFLHVWPLFSCLIMRISYIYSLISLLSTHPSYAATLVSISLSVWS